MDELAPPPLLDVPAELRKRLSPTQERLISAGLSIQDEIEKGLAHEQKDMRFNHSILCQVSLPRSRVDGLTFERKHGSASILIQAGFALDAKTNELVQQPIPYGPLPRLLLIHLSTEAKRGKREVYVGKSISEFLKTLNMSSGGHDHARLKRNLQALAACSLTLGYKNTTAYSRPIEALTLWESKDKWDGIIRLSDQFYSSFGEERHCAPLHPTALKALSHHSLALDLYCWLAYRLKEISAGGQKLYWTNLKQQFGQDYKSLKEFKKNVRPALRAVLCVYPQAKVELIDGELRLYQSDPPIRPRAK